MNKFEYNPKEKCLHVVDGTYGHAMFVRGRVNESSAVAILNYGLSRPSLRIVEQALVDERKMADVTIEENGFENCVGVYTGGTSKIRESFSNAGFTDDRLGRKYMGESLVSIDFPIPVDAPKGLSEGMESHFKNKVASVLHCANQPAALYSFSSLATTNPSTPFLIVRARKLHEQSGGITDFVRQIWDTYAQNEDTIKAVLNQNAHLDDRALLLKVASYFGWGEEDLNASIIKKNEDFMGGLSGAWNWLKGKFAYLFSAKWVRFVLGALLIMVPAAGYGILAWHPTFTTYGRQVLSILWSLLVGGGAIFTKAMVMPSPTGTTTSTFPMKEWFHALLPDATLHRLVEDDKEIEIAFTPTPKYINEVAAKELPNFPSDRIDGYRRVDFSFNACVNEAAFSLLRAKLLERGAAVLCDRRGEKHITTLIPLSSLKGGVNGRAFESRLAYVVSTMEDLTDQEPGHQLHDRVALEERFDQTKGAFKNLLIENDPVDFAFTRKKAVVSSLDLPVLFKSKDEVTMLCEDGNYLVAYRRGNEADIYHGVEKGKKAIGNIMEYYPSLVAYGQGSMF